MVRSFHRTTEASFPDNDSLPKKSETEKKFDKRFNDWWDEVRVNLSKLEDQVTKYISKDLQDELANESERRARDISGLDDTTTQLIKSLDNQILALKSDVTAIQDNLYSE